MELSNFIDIHTHVIPCVDDGAESFVLAMEMIKLAKKQGIKSLIATPHSGAFDKWKSPVYSNYSKLRAAIDKEQLDISLMLGAEIYVDRDTVKSVVKKIKRHKYPSLNNTAYVLVEFSPSEHDLENSAFCISHMVDGGYMPIIAHAEKYQLELEQIYELKELGCFIQVNFESISPLASYSTTSKASTMLKDEMIDFLATDMHDMTNRKPETKEALLFLQNNCSTSYLNKILCGNPILIK